MARDLSRYNPSPEQLAATERQIDECLAQRLAADTAKARRFFERSKMPKVYLQKIRQRALEIWRDHQRQQMEDMSDAG